MYIESIELQNIQSHIQTKVDLPEHGLIRFFGPNNNGKSVIGKALFNIISNQISRPAVRKSLVRRGSTEGHVIITRSDKVKLLVNIALEASSTFAELTRDDGSTIRRYLADKSIPALIREFGFHYLPEYNVSLQIHQDEDSPLIVDTPTRLNGALFASACSDPIAEHAIEALGDKIKNFEQLKSSLNLELSKIDAKLETLSIHDIDKETQLKEKLSYYYNNIRNLKVYDLPELPTVPRLITFSVPSLPDIKYPNIHAPVMELPDIMNIVSEIETIKKGVCPTCLREFF